jgi:hypothetical protein
LDPTLNSDRVTSPTEQQLESEDVLTTPESSIPATDQAQATKQVEGFDRTLYEDMLNDYEEDEDEDEDENENENEEEDEDEDEDEEDSDEEAESEEEDESEEEEDEDEEEEEEGSDDEQGSNEEEYDEEEGSEEEEEYDDEEGSEAEEDEEYEEEDEENLDEKPKRKKGRQLESGFKDLQKMLKATSANASKEDLFNSLESLESGSDESEGDEMTPAENDV